MAQPDFRRGESVRVGDRTGTFVKRWGAGAVIRFDLRPQEPKVVPIARIQRA